MKVCKGIHPRASRLSSFADLHALQPVLDQLCEQKLVEPLTPSGRGQLFAHTLYQNQEKQYLLERIQKRQVVDPKTTTSPVTANLDAVEKLVARLEEVTTRIDALEQRLSELEN